MSLGWRLGESQLELSNFEPPGYELQCRYGQRAM